MKNVFLKTAIITIAVFVIGMYCGFVLDSMRVAEVESRLTEIDNLWNDVRLMQSYIEKFSNNSEYCNFMLEENLKIGDKIYEEGLLVEEYKDSNRFGSLFVTEKQRYALLDLQFWLNSIELKKVCNGNYSTVIYFYSQNIQNAEQKFQDMVLWDLKQRCGPKIIYITFPSDMDITTIEIIKNIYNIEKIPSVLIDESILLESPASMETLEEYITC
ncbi:MAG: hypothetical protein JW700_04280 [Candidatus Aenigmarchaeota archaeon]|nr:hypothetical protein [Candidatus Aenigmarchaeota archaeon]